MTEWKRQITITPGHDCHDECKWGSDRCKPGAGGYHGVGAARIHFELSGGPEDDALSVDFFTHWYLAATRERMKGSALASMLADGLGSVSWHWRTGEDHEYANHTDDCTLLGGECWSDGSGLMTNDAFEVLVAGGSDALWEWMIEKVTH